MLRMFKFLRQTVRRFPLCCHLQKESALMKIGNSCVKENLTQLVFRNAHTKAFKTEELKIAVPFGHIAIKAWGSPKAFPVFLFHGWLDNCGTFDRLIPLLSDEFYYLGIDAPGHGLSSHKSPGCVYTNLDLIMAFKDIIDDLGISKLHIIGHSMGSALASIMASMYPELIEKLVMIDTVKPFSMPSESVCERIKTGMETYKKLEKKLNKSPPVYAFESAIERLMDGMHQEVTRESAEVLLKRGSRKSPCGKGIVFSRDLRIRPIEDLSAVSHEIAENIITRVVCDVLIILATNSNPYYTPDSPEMIEHFCTIFKKNAKSFYVEHIEGNHFIHLNNAERIGPLINNFLSK